LYKSTIARSWPRHNARHRHVLLTNLGLTCAACTPTASATLDALPRLVQTRVRRSCLFRHHVYAPASRSATPDRRHQMHVAVLRFEVRAGVGIVFCSRLLELPFVPTRQNPFGLQPTQPPQREAVGASAKDLGVHAWSVSAHLGRPPSLERQRGPDVQGPERCTNLLRVLLSQGFAVCSRTRLPLRREAPPEFGAGCSAPAYGSPGRLTNLGLTCGSFTQPAMRASRSRRQVQTRVRRHGIFATVFTPHPLAPLHLIAAARCTVLLPLDVRGCVASRGSRPPRVSHSCPCDSLAGKRFVSRAGAECRSLGFRLTLLINAKPPERQRAARGP
jgi:hypothetical protein